MNPQPLHGLRAKSYEHPLEQQALGKLKDTRGFRKLVNKFYELGFEHAMKAQYEASCLKVSARNFSHLQYLLEKAAEMLEVDPVPSLHIQHADQLGALTLGAESPMIVLTSECIDHLSNQELLFLLGREVAQFKSDHILYKEIGLIFPELMDALSMVTLGLSAIVSTGLRYALFSWSITAEFTADRGGLLACQDPETAVLVLAKFAGLPRKHWSTPHLEEFKEQARALASVEPKMLDKIVSYMFDQNNWAVSRTRELLQWIEEGAYASLLASHAPTGGDSSA